MLTLKAKLLHSYKSTDFTNVETGEVTIGKNKLQLLTEVPLKNGSFRNELLSISIPNEKVSQYVGKEGKEVEVDVAYFGKTTFYGI